MNEIKLAYKMKIPIAIFAFLLLLLITGCGTAPKVAVPQPATVTKAEKLTPDSGKALIYFIRPYYFPASGVSLPVTINDEPFGNVDVKTYIFANVDPGVYTVGFGEAASHLPKKQVIAKEGEIYFMICTGGNIVGINGVNQIDQLEGEKAINKYKLSGDLFYEFKHNLKSVY